MAEIRRARILRGEGEPISQESWCTFVISIGSFGPDLDQLCAGWDWTRLKFDKCSMLVGDSLQRLTIQATEGRSARDAEREAMDRASALVNRLVAVRPGATVMRTSEIAALPSYGRWSLRIQKAFENIAPLRSIIVDDAMAFCERQRRRGSLTTSVEQARSLAINYLTEEVAIYGVLAEQGWLVETYLGSELNVLAAFMRGEFPGVAPELERRTHISLRVSTLRRAA